MFLLCESLVAAHYVSHDVVTFEAIPELISKYVELFYPRVRMFHDHSLLCQRLVEGFLLC